MTALLAITRLLLDALRALGLGTLLAVARLMPVGIRG